MAVIETWRRRDLNSLTQIEYLQGNLFSQDAAGNLIGVELYSGGEAYSGGGSVSANVIRADGGTVAVTGSISGNKASVTLPAACYAVVGPIIIVVKLTVNSVVTTIGAFASSVYASTTGATVDPGTLVTSVQTLITNLAAATASFADYSGLLAMIAPTYSTSGKYAVGDYVIYNNGLYRCTTAITSGESWTSGHWTAVKIGGEVSDLKSALSSAVECYYQIQPVWTKGSINASGNDVVDNGRYRTVGMLDAVVGDNYIFTGENYNSPIVRWYDANGTFKSSTTSITPDENGDSFGTVSAPQPKFRVVINTDNTTTHPTSTSNLKIEHESELLKRIASDESALTLLTLLSVKSSNKDQINKDNYSTNFTPDTQPENSVAVYGANITNAMTNDLPTYGYAMAIMRFTQKPGMEKQYGDKEVAFVENGDMYFRSLAWSSSIPEGVWGNWVQITTGLSKERIVSTNTLSFDILGDSFSGKTKSWHYYVAKLLGWTNKNYSVSGSRVALDSTIGGNTRLSFLHRCANIDSTADAVVIFGGINDATDINNGDLALGDMTSTVNDITDTATTFYGALRGVIEYVHSSNMMPNKPIIGIIPPDFEPTPASRVTILHQIQEAEREIYTYYQIPYIDLAKECQEMFESAYNNATYRNVGDGAETPAEGYHPSTLGYKAIANTVWGKMFQLLNERAKIESIT